MLDGSSPADTWTVAELAAALKVREATIRGWIAVGKVEVAPRLSDGSPWRIPVAEVERLTQGNGMGARYDNDRKQWFCDFMFHHSNGRRERIRLDSPVNTRQGALQYEQQVRRELAASTYHRAGGDTVRQYMRSFLDYCELDQMKPSTIDSYERILDGHIIPRFGNVRLGEITTEAVDKWRADQIGAGLSQKTVNNQCVVLMAMLRVACDEHKKIATVPRIRLFKRAPLRDQHVDFLTPEEVDKLLAAAGAWRCLIIVALNTALRRGELIALRWEDVDLKAGRITLRRNYYQREFVTPKSGRVREVPLNDTTIAALKAHPRPLRCELVFHTAAGGPIIESAMTKGLARACKRAGIRRIGWHRLRHTCASWLVQRGVNLYKVKDVLGHSTIQMTERYAHLSPECLRDAVSVLDAPLDAFGHGNGMAMAQTRKTESSRS